MLLLLENIIGGGVLGVISDRHVVSDVNKQILYIDANNLYGWARSQYVPTGEFEKVPFNQNNYTDTEGASRDYNLEQLVK